MKQGGIVALAVAVTLATGCASVRQSVNPGGEYYANAPIEFMDALKVIRGKSVRLDAFALEGDGELKSECSLAGGVVLLPPVGRTFQEYFRYALAEELKVVGAVSPDAPVSLKGTIHRISLTDDGPDRCAWTIEASLASSNGHTLRVRGVHRYLRPPGPNVAELTRNRVLYQFAPAVQTTMKGFFTHRDFPSLFQGYSR